MLIAICQKYLNLPLWEFDVFINIANGFEAKEPAADLAICAAINSSYKDKPLSSSLCFIGEVSLLGMVQQVSKNEKRIKQAKQLGMKEVVGYPGIRMIKELEARSKK